MRNSVGDTQGWPCAKCALMAIIYNGYERDMKVWLQGRVDAFTRAYAGMASANMPSAVCERVANEAVQAFLRAFPEPVYEEWEDY